MLYLGVSEDCLYLNVFTKNLAVPQQRNVFEQVRKG